MTNMQVRFIADEPIESFDSDDALRHRSLATQIVDTVKTCPTPFAVGLSGDWGSGKTSVADEVRRQLSAIKDSRFVFVYFDAWKYERDSLRRQFLIRAHADLKSQGCLKDSDLDLDSLYNTVRVSQPQQIVWDALNPFRRDLRKSAAAVFRSVLALAAIAGYLAVIVLMFRNKMPESLVSAVAGAGGLLGFIALLPRVSVVESPEVVKQPVTAAEKFEEVFTRWTEKLKGSRLLVVVDNLDRCADAQTVEMLGDIKTFLEPARADVVFLLPVDENAIRRAIRSRYGDSTTAAEFLRKFFNTIFRMPTPLSAETKYFASTKLGATNLVTASGADAEEMARVVSVMLAGYANNPRRIIQFLNRLVAHWMQLYATAQAIKRPEIASELAVIAKCQVIRERWPAFADLLELNPRELDAASRRAVGGDEVTIVEGPEVSSILVGLAQFLRATRSVQVERARLFLTAKADVFEALLPDAELLRSYLRGEQSSSLVDLLEQPEWEGASLQQGAADLIAAELRELAEADIRDAFAVAAAVVGYALHKFDEATRASLANQMVEVLKRSGIAAAVVQREAVAIVRIASSSKEPYRRDVRVVVRDSFASQD